MEIFEILPFSVTERSACINGKLRCKKSLALRHGFVFSCCANCKQVSANQSLMSFTEGLQNIALVVQGKPLVSRY